MQRSPCERSRLLSWPLWPPLRPTPRNLDRNRQKTGRAEGVESKCLDPIQVGRENEGTGQSAPRTAHTEEGLKGAGTRERSSEEVDLFRIGREQHTCSNHQTGKAKDEAVPSAELSQRTPDSRANRSRIPFTNPRDSEVPYFLANSMASLMVTCAGTSSMNKSS